MKKSITRRMFIGIIAVVIGFSIIILVANSLLLKPLYYRSIENTMISAIDETSEVDFSTDRASWIENLYDINSGNTYDIIIKQNNITVFSSSFDIGLLTQNPELDKPEDNEKILDRRPQDPFESVNSVQDWEEVKENIFMGRSVDPRSNNEFMVCSTQIDNTTSIYLTQPIEPINESIAQSNILLLLCTLIVLVISIFFAFRFSRSFTKPIKKIQNQVDKISNLDFSDQLDIETGDELESLSSDINILAEKLKIALEELRVKNLQLEKDILAQKSFISNASHELRTPLSIIKGYADELNSGFIEDIEQQKFYHEIISEESTKMKRLLNEMLDLSRLESGRMELAKKNFSINEFIFSFIDKYSGFIKENKLDVELKLCENCSGYHDDMRVEQILANYISNASKYSDVRKKIVISTKIIESDVRVSVFNYGGNIAEEALEHIWDGFYKADNVRTRADDSYGLGLSIVKAIQNISGQSYGVLNHEDGVEFWFDIKLV